MTQEPGRRRHPTQEPGRRRHPTQEPGRRRHPTQEPESRRHPTQEPESRQQDAGSPPRPPDVDTGFWLWMAAVPLMVTAYVVDLLNAPIEIRPWYVDAVSGVFVFTLAAVVVTFLFLMRSGYRWARTLLTGGGATSVVYVVTNLLSVDRPTTAAVVFAVSAIVGSVLIVGGIYLLHRKDVYEFFTR